MGRKRNISISSKFRGRRSLRELQIRSERKYLLIVCEGQETEPNYFRAIQKKLPRELTSTVNIIGTGANTKSVVKFAKREVKRAQQQRGREYDEVWVVIDRDSFPAEHFNAAIAQCIATPKFYCAWSNEAFELWYVLHFQYRNTAMSRGDYERVITDELTKQLPDSELPFRYRKNDERMYQLLQTYGNEADAIRNAKKLVEEFVDERFATHNPCTRIFALVERLNALRET